MKSETALERFAAIDTIVFDKTGTLTTLEPQLIGLPQDKTSLAIASAIAASSKHPLAQAIRAAAPDIPRAKGVNDTPGMGLAWTDEAGEEVRLGSARWCGVAEHSTADTADDSGGLETEVWLTRPGHAPARFVFAPQLRPRTAGVIKDLKARGFDIAIMSAIGHGS